MKSIVVLQARTNSLRLPGKVLLPIHGIPVVVLAAMRAGNTGKRVIVATSKETGDDALAELLKAHDISCFRGDLDNALQRIVDALSEYSNNTLVFRLTADNVFPDGPLLEEIEQDFIERNVEYLCCNGEPSGLPYGMSVELTRLHHLRHAASSTDSAFDQEHVTPFIRRKFGEQYFRKYQSLGKGHFRCTIDCLDDYLSVQSVFSGLTDPIQVSSFELLKSIEKTAYQPSQPKPAQKLVLGTAQLGLVYGIANHIGQVNPESAQKLVKTAISNGVSYIDTARAYGNSEEVIGTTVNLGWNGRAKIITKLSPLSSCPPDAELETINAFVDASIYASCTALRMQTLDTVLLHRAEHVRKWRGAAWSRLKFLRESGRIRALGVSIQTPKELEACLDNSDIEFIQMPFNVLDWRWDDLLEIIKARKLRQPLIIHVRSALLQGLLPSTCGKHWHKAGINDIDSAKLIQWLQKQCRLFERTSVADFCLAYAMSTDWIDGVVVGVESPQQLEENIRTFTSPILTKEQIKEIKNNRPKINYKILDPAKWK